MHVKINLLFVLRLAAARLREKESAVLETELELRGDEPVGSGPDNEIGLKAVVPLGEDDAEFVEDCPKEDIDLIEIDELQTKLDLKEEENEALLSEAELKKVPMQLAIAGRPNVGKSTLLNTLLQEERVLTGPEPGLTRDSIRVEFEYEGQKIFLVSLFIFLPLMQVALFYHVVICFEFICYPLFQFVKWFFVDSGVWQVDTAGWMQRSKLKEGPAALSAMNARRNVQRAHVVALVLDAQEVFCEQPTIITFSKCISSTIAGDYRNSRSFRLVVYKRKYCVNIIVL